MIRNSSNRGLFICFEGPDGSGKTTQCKLLTNALDNYMTTTAKNSTTNTIKPTLSLRFPDRTTPLGLQLDAYLKGRFHQIEPHALHLLFTANRWERQAAIKSALESNRHVVCDRYSYSGIAYTCAKPVPDDSSLAPTMPWCIATERELIRPDLVLCLLPGTTSDLLDRSGFGQERYETLDFQDRVIGNYLKLTELEKGEQLKDDGRRFWNNIACTGASIDEVHNQIWSIVKAWL